MSTTRCEHGNVVEDTVGVYRCYQCEPFGEADLQELEQAFQDELDDELKKRDARIAELEQAVAELAERAGVAFKPPEGE